MKKKNENKNFWKHATYKFIEREINIWILMWGAKLTASPTNNDIYTIEKYQ